MADALPRTAQATPRGRRVGLALVAGGFLLSACAPPGLGSPVVPGQDALPASPTADEPPGLVIFREVGCSACHGANGEGGVGPPLAGHTLEQVFRQVRAPKGDIMPPFSADVLSDEDVRAIHAWIETLGGEMVMAHPEEDGGHDEAGGAAQDHETAADHAVEMDPTEVSHLRLMLIAVDAGNVDDALSHIDHLALHGGDPDLLDLADRLRTDLQAGRLHDAEERALEVLGPVATEHFDAVAAHVGMALSASQRDDVGDVEHHLQQAAAAAAGHDHEARLEMLLRDWRAGEDRHGVVDALYAELGIEHPPH